MKKENSYSKKNRISETKNLTNLLSLRGILKTDKTTPQIKEEMKSGWL